MAAAAPQPVESFNHQSDDNFCASVHARITQVYPPQSSFFGLIETKT